MKKNNLKHFLFLTAAAVGSIHLLNRFIENTAEMKNMLKSDNQNFYDWKNGKIYYSISGTGSPILLVHDLSPIASSYEWCRLIKKLEKNHTVYTIDLLGCGRSEKPCMTYTNYLYVQLITDFIKDIIKESPTVIATHKSTSFIIQAANMDNNLINGIIAINPPEIEDFDKQQDKFSNILKFILELPIIGTFFYNIDTIETNIQKTLRETYFFNPQLVSTKMFDTYYESAHKGNSHGKYLKASIIGNYFDNAVGAALKNLEIPIYIIESNHLKDSVQIVESYRKINSDIESTYLSNVGLIPQLEMPEKLLQTINMFLD